MNNSFSLHNEGIKLEWLLPWINKNATLTWIVIAATQFASEFTWNHMPNCIEIKCSFSMNCHSKKCNSHIVLEKLSWIEMQHEHEFLLLQHNLYLNSALWALRHNKCIFNDSSQAQFMCHLTQNHLTCHRTNQKLVPCATMYLAK